MGFLSDFIDKESREYDPPYDNLFSNALAQVVIYHDYLMIILDRHKQAVGCLEPIVKSFLEPSRESDQAARAALLSESRRLDTLVQLETETFYIFAKILLDRVAIFLRDYFPRVQGLKHWSHDQFTKENEVFRQANNLTYPQGFIESLRSLDTLVCLYRDKQITHVHNLRAVKGILFSPDGAKILTGYLHPKETDTHHESTDLQTLMVAIDTYIGQLVETIELNRHISRYKSKTA